MCGDVNNAVTALKHLKDLKDNYKKAQAIVLKIKNTIDHAEFIEKLEKFNLHVEEILAVEIKHQQDIMMSTEVKHEIKPGGGGISHQ